MYVNEQLCKQFAVQHAEKRNEITVKKFKQKKEKKPMNVYSS